MNMDYEKEYKAARERASIIYTGKYKPEIAAFCKQTLETVFPELEDYSDMRIIKEITSFLKQKGAYNKEWIDWLEKLAPNPQGKSALEAIEEEKEEEEDVDNAYKVETKFKVGDWIVATGKLIYKVIEIREQKFDESYILIDTDNNEYEFGIQSIECDGRLWTIQDAEDGDVLVASDGSIFVFAGTDDSDCCKHYVALATDGVIVFNKGLKEAWESSRGVHPATEEQRVLLFQKMKEAGYEWDADNKQLIKIIDYEEDNV